jgi:hypothetical protein
VRKLKRVTILDIITLSTNMYAPRKGCSYYFMMVQWKEGLHSFVKNWEASIYGSLCKNYNSINQPSPTVRKLKPVTMQNIIILFTKINDPWKGYSYYYMMVQWKKGLHSSCVKTWQTLIGDSLCENYNSTINQPSPGTWCTST